MVVGATARLTRLDGDLVIFLWYLATVFFLLLATWRLANVCFDYARARWFTLVLITTLLTIPVAGTALALVDPYLTARSASTPLIVLAVASFLSGRRASAILWILLSALVHPMMAAFGIALLGILALPSRWTEPSTKKKNDSRPEPAHARKSKKILALRAFTLPFGLGFAPVSPEYRQAIEMRPFLFLARWAWYEQCGLAAPLIFLVWAGRTLPRGASRSYPRLANAAAILGVMATLVGALLSCSHTFDNLARLQPLRAFHLIYLIFFVLLGGLLGEHLPEGRVWLRVCVFAAIGTGMFLTQRISYPDSAHIELPWVAPKNPWVAAFLWTRNNTPSDAVFALDPRYIELPGEDRHGFRAIAERSMLTDYVKDSGVVSLFPGLAAEWYREQQAQRGWSHFEVADFQRIAARYPVSWVVLEARPPEGLACPYRNAAVTICRIPGARGWQGASTRLSTK